MNPPWMSWNKEEIIGRATRKFFIGSKVHVLVNFTDTIKQPLSFHCPSTQLVSRSRSFESLAHSPNRMEAMSS